MNSFVSRLLQSIPAALRPLPAPTEQAMQIQHDAQLARLLPLLGPLLGVSVLMFGFWDLLIDPARAGSTMLVRLGGVLIGSLAYFERPLGGSVARRCALIYSSHASAIIICEFMLSTGFLAGLAGITAGLFAVAVSTLRPRVFLATAAPPALLFVALGAWRLPLPVFVACLMQYLFAFFLATVVMLVIRQFHQKAFLSEQELLNVSRHDGLTGAFNRRYLDEVAERELALARRHGHPLAVAMIDIDHFKEVNDNFGHDIGDRVLQQLVRTCRAELRGIDHFGRLGGEEFICLLPETGQLAALQCAERLRLNLQALCMDTPHGPLRFTVSIGVAVLDTHHADWAALLRDADQAMYRAKHAGRNCVMLAQPIALLASASS